ncbi:MAG TPA: hypothetical protein VE842_15065 [Pyrinomonadaceae bacterium]|nr:hypothetical protein [Pyrinomonadaceae bacterium]
MSLEREIETRPPPEKAYELSTKEGSQKMASSELKNGETDTSRRTILLVFGILSAVLIAGLLYWMTRPGPSGGAGGPQRLEGALRPGSPEFEQYKSKIVLDKPEATEATRPIGDIVMTLSTTVRNFTGRTISGLEIYAAVVDSQGKPVKERIMIAVPSRRTGQVELDPNRTIEVPVMLEGMSKEDDRANIVMDVAAFKFK